MQAAELKTMKPVEMVQVAALLNPRPVVLVTCCDAAGKPNILTVAWQTPLSHQPPLVGISIGLSRYSHPLIEQSGEFVINIVGRSFEEAARICGNTSGQQADKAILAELKLQSACRVQPPVIAGALAHLECRVVQTVPAGDHTFFIAEVLYASAQSPAFEKAWTGPGADVLLCVQRDRFDCLLVEPGGDYD